MAYLAEDIADKRLLKIIRRFMETGIMQNGVCQRREEGVSQGSPLSPLLSNIMLDRLDKELERRGHKFCRYADDCNIYVGSQASGERVMESVKQFVEGRLHLKVNEQKSAVAQVWERKFLGYSFRRDGELKVSEVSQKKFKDKIRKLTKRNRGRSLEQVIKEMNSYLNGWISYFRLSGGIGEFRKLDSWIRRKLRCYRLKQCKRGRSMVKYLIELGASKQQAGRLGMSSKGWWRLSLTSITNYVMPNKWFDALGLVNLERRILGFKR
jgi:RNA-directed DNA polymerase